MPNSDIRLKKTMIVILGVITAFAPLSIDLYLPALPQLSNELGISSMLAQQSLSLFFVGLATGQLFYGPLADRYGRRAPLTAGILLYLSATVVCALAPNIETLLIGRLLQGFGAAAGPVIARAIVRDIYSGRRAAQVMSFVILVMAAAPLVAPILGGWVTTLLGWRANFWVLGAFGVMCLLLVIYSIPETHPQHARPISALRYLFSGYLPVITDAASLPLLGAGGMAFAALFAYVAGSPFVYTEVFGVSETAFGYFFGLNVIGLVLGNLLNSQLVMHYGARRLMQFGISILATGSICILILVLNGVTSQWMITPFLFISLGTVGVIAANTVSSLLNRHPQNAGAASALFGVSQFGLGALSALIIGLVPFEPLLAMAVVMTGSGLLAVFSMLQLKR